MLLPKLIEHLHHGHYDALEAAFGDARAAGDSWSDKDDDDTGDMIHHVCTHLAGKETGAWSERVLRVCANILNWVAGRGSAKANLIALLEFCAQDQPLFLFRLLLPPLRRTLFALPDVQRPRMWPFAWEAIVRRIQRCPERSFKDGYNVNKEDTEMVEDVAKVMDEFQTFAQPFADTILQEQESVHVQSVRVSFLNALLHVFANPLSHYCLEAPSRIMKSAAGLLALLEQVAPNLIVCSSRSVWNSEANSEEDDNLLAWTPSAGVTCALFVQYASDVVERSAVKKGSKTSNATNSANAPATIPSCYSPLHLLKHIIALVNHLFDALASLSNLYLVLKLSQYLLERVDRLTLTADDLSSREMVSFQEKLVATMTYCSYTSRRKSALEVLELLYDRLEVDARPSLCFQILRQQCHSGLRAWVIKKVRDSVLLNLQPGQTILHPAFASPRLDALVLSCFKLETDKDGSVDLLEASEEVIAGLNSLWVLFVRDRKNQTGLADCLPMLKRNFINPIEANLDTSRLAHEERLKSMASGDGSGVVDDNGSAETTSQLSPEQAEELLHRAKNMFELMKCAQVKLSEEIKG